MRKWRIACQSCIQMSHWQKRTLGLRLRSSSTSTNGSSGSFPRLGEINTEDLKAEILGALRADISSVLKSELNESLSEDFNCIKSAFQAVKNELAKQTTRVRTELDTVKKTVSSTCSDDTTNTVKKLETDVTSLKEQCIPFTRLFAKIQCQDHGGSRGLYRSQVIEGSHPNG